MHTRSQLVSKRNENVERKVASKNGHKFSISQIWRGTWSGVMQQALRSANNADSFWESNERTTRINVELSIHLQSLTHVSKYSFYLVNSEGKIMVYNLFEISKLPVNARKHWARFIQFFTSLHNYLRLNRSRNSSVFRFNVARLSRNDRKFLNEFKMLIELTDQRRERGSERAREFWEINWAH